MKDLYIAEKPSVAAEFAKALDISRPRRDGYIESENSIVTWCVGHLVTMSYPEDYDAALKRWSFETLPFIPEKYKYRVIPEVRKQYETVISLMKRDDVGRIFVCTDSGREGEYIFRLVDMMAGCIPKEKRRVWIDSQTKDEILRGIREARPESDYDDLAAAAYLRAQEDYLMGINFSRALTIKYGNDLAAVAGEKRTVISAGRVMTCVLGMVVRREREIRTFEKKNYYGVEADCSIHGAGFTAGWKVSGDSFAFGTPLLYKDNGFNERKTAEDLISVLPDSGVISEVSKKREKRNPSLLYNLAELQNDCSKLFKISPDDTLKIAQELYEKRLTTYPRTDARVLTQAVAKEIGKNLAGLKSFPPAAPFAQEILSGGLHEKLGKSRYVNDKAVTDHYAIIPTGQGFNALGNAAELTQKVYLLIVCRFLAVFYPAAEYQKLSLVIRTETDSERKSCEDFYASFRVPVKEGYLKTDFRKLTGKSGKTYTDKNDTADDVSEEEKNSCTGLSDADILKLGKTVKKGDIVSISSYSVKERETSPPRRYTSGSMILAMENAGELIENEELRAQIKGSGIGTSATRAEILKKLVNIGYLSLNRKTQSLTPTLLGEMVFDVTKMSVRQLLEPKLTASWEKGLTLVANGEVSSAEYSRKLNDFVVRRTDAIRNAEHPSGLRAYLGSLKSFYRSGK